MGRGRSMGKNICRTFFRRRLPDGGHRQHNCSSSSTCSRRPKKEGDQGIGKSRGGSTTKIHTLTEASGNLVHFRLTGGHRHDSTQALELIDGIWARYFLADKAYDSLEIRNAIEARHGEVVIPSHPTRRVQRSIDKEIYKARNRIERFFCRLKDYRRIATRYDKLARNFAAFILIVSAIVCRD